LPDKHTFQDVELTSIGDTLIVNMSLGLKGRDYLMTYIVSPDKSLTSAPNLHGTNKKPICGIVSLSGGRKRVYFLDQAKKEFRIKAIEANFGDKSIIDVPGEGVFDGRMLAMLTENNQVTIFSKDKGIIHEITLEGVKGSTKKSYVLPSTMSAISAHEVSIRREGDYAGVLEAKSDLKLFVNNDWITAILDYGGYGYTSAYTVIARYERSSGKVISRTFPTETETTLNSTILDTIVYRTINSSGVFKLESFDLKSAKKIYEHKIVLSTANADQLVYFREGRANKIGKGQTLKVMMKNSAICEAFAIAQYQGDSTLITWGTYFDENGPGAFVGPDPFTGMIAMFVASTINQSIPGPGVSMYFYLMGNVRQGFKFRDNPDCLRTRIDSFEMAQQKEDLARKLGYYKFNGSIISVYYLPKKNKLKLVKFEA